MILNSYDIIYLISNIFGTYVIFRFMRIFFSRRVTNSKIEFASYVLYYIIIGAVYLTFNKIVINVFSNLILFFLLTLNYSSKWRLRLAATALIYAISISIEASVVFCIKIFNINSLTQNVDIELIIALISTKIVSYLIMLILSNFKMIKQGINVSLSHWLAIFIVPLGTLFSTFLLITLRTTYNLIFTVIGILLLFVINVLVFYLYDYLMQTDQEKMEKILLKQENESYIRQFQIVKESQERIKILRHDTKNHLAMLQSLIEKKDNDQALKYIETTFDFINDSDDYSNSGNLDIDCILNYKIHEAQKYDIKVDLSLKIPNKLNIQLFDLSVILGNLLDNAITATSKVEKDNRIIKVAIELDRNVIYIRLILIMKFWIIKMVNMKLHEKIKKILL